MSTVETRIEKILRLRFIEDLTYEEIGKRLSPVLGKERIRQIIWKEADRWKEYHRKKHEHRR